MIASNTYVIGVDYGSDSVRTIIADAHNGNEIAASVYNYPRWKDQLYCNAGQNQFRHTSFGKQFLQVRYWKKKE